MSARERTERLLKEFVKGTAGTTAADDERVRQLVDGIVDSVKEECCSGSQRWEIAADFEVRTAEPELIRGYTAENWQEIIDGGYLCEYWGGDFTENCKDKPIGLLLDFDEESRFHFKENASWWSFCRPAQIKGVMRPIFVEPVDKDAWCHFFLGIDRIMFGVWSDFSGLASSSGATKYIEL